MIILDTNIVSEVMRPNPDPNTIDWLNDQTTENLYLTTISIAEINYGLHILPAGKRRDGLAIRFNSFIERGFGQRIMMFDIASAKDYGEIMGNRRKIGKPMSVPDGQIAAIASASGSSLATRNIKDFERCGISLLNPFEYNRGKDGG